MFRDGKSTFAGKSWLWLRGTSLRTRRHEKRGRRKWTRRLTREHVREQLTG